jgi:hypothetical protein
VLVAWVGVAVDPVPPAYVVDMSVTVVVSRVTRRVAVGYT